MYEQPNPKIAAMMSGLSRGDNVPLQSGPTADQPGALPIPNDQFMPRLQEVTDYVSDLSRDMRSQDRSPTTQDDLIDLNKIIGDVRKILKRRNQALQKQASERAGGASY